MKTAFIALFVLSILVGCDQSPPASTEQSPPQPATSSPSANSHASNTSPSVDTLTQLKRKAASLNTGRQGNEKWYNANYNYWGSDDPNQPYGGTIEGNVHHYIDSFQASDLAYQVSLAFRNGTWIISNIDGVEIKILPLKLETEKDLPSDPALDSIMKPDDDLSTKETFSDISRQIATVQRGIDNNKRLFDSVKGYPISQNDQHAIRTRLDDAPTKVSADAEAAIKPHMTSWIELDSIRTSDANTMLQQTEEWKHFEGKPVSWSGTIYSVDEHQGDLSMDIKMHPTDKGINLKETSYAFDVSVHLLKSEKAKALRLHPRDEVNFTGSVSRLPTESSVHWITIENGEIGKNPSEIAAEEQKAKEDALRAEELKKEQQKQAEEEAVRKAEAEKKQYLSLHPEIVEKMEQEKKAEGARQAELLKQAEDAKQAELAKQAEEERREQQVKQEKWEREVKAWQDETTAALNHSGSAVYNDRLITINYSNTTMLWHKGTHFIVVSKNPNGTVRVKNEVGAAYTAVSDSGGMPLISNQSYEIDVPAAWFTANRDSFSNVRGSTQY